MQLLKRLLPIACCWALLAPTACAQTTLLTNLEVYAKFDNDVTDASGNGRNGTAGGSPSYATGVINNGVDLESGSSQYVDFPTSVPVDNVSAFSVSLWVKPESLPVFQNFVMKGSQTSSSSRWTIGVGGSGSESLVRFAVGNGSNSYGQTATGILSTGVLTHIVAVFDGSQSGNANRCKIYINGVNETLSFSGTIPGTTSNQTSQALRVGRTDTTYADGVIDEMGVWSRALTGSEAAQLYNSGAGLPYSSFGGGGDNGPVIQNYYRRLRAEFKPASPWDRFVSRTPLMLARN